MKLLMLGYLWQAACVNVIPNYCEEPVLIGEINQQMCDQLQISYKRCPEKFDNKPCIKYMRRTSEYSYQVICSEKRK